MKFKEYSQLKEIIGTVAMWISPRGEILAKQNTNHIAMVIENPQKFGLTKEYVEEKYKEYGEPLGVEGKAREEIIRELVKNGWIRIRRYTNKFWSITINKLTKKVKDYLFDWAQKTLTGIAGFKEADKYMPVNIVALGGSSVPRNITIQGVANDVLFESNEKFDFGNILTEVESIDEFSE